MLYLLVGLMKSYFSGLLILLGTISPLIDVGNASLAELSKNFLFLHSACKGLSGRFKYPIECVPHSSKHTIYKFIERS